jgi:hypothetical protein
VVVEEQVVVEVAAQVALVVAVQVKQAMVAQELNPGAVHKVPAERALALAVQHRVLL